MNLKLLFTSIIASIFLCTVSAQEKITRQQYIDKYQLLAIEQMEIYGIPASIKMAQALLESDNGNSRLAREANNHFGIKCKSTWTGPTLAHTDDAPNECFRKYGTAEESYLDHSEFLDKSPRYDVLFKLPPKDYTAWAHGLKETGYATNPLYAQILIKIIEDNQLYLLDEGNRIEVNVTPAVEPIIIAPQTPAATIGIAGTVDVDNYSISVYSANSKHVVYSNNGSEFVIAQRGDSFASLASEYVMSTKKLLKFNDYDNYRELNEGDMVYIRAKNRRSENGKLIHITKDGETMHSISQIYGIKLKNLCNINRRSKDSEVKAGQQIRLM